MRSSTPGAEEKLRSDLQNAKKAKKKAKTAYKNFKDKLKPLKQALKEAQKAEKLAKAALKSTLGSAPVTSTTDAGAPKRRGRQPGYSPKAAVAAAAPPKATPSKKPITSTGGGDDLTQVKGVGENIAVMLKANGVTTFADMAATSFERYKELLKANGMSKFRDPSQWAARAAEIAKMPAPKKTETKAAAEPAAPKKRGRQPGFSPKASQKSAVSHEAHVAELAKVAAKVGGDDLTKVKGVGDNIAVMLKANGVTSYADMAATSFDRYKELLKANGMSKFRDPSQWAARAAELAKTLTPQKAAPKAAAPAAPAEPKKRGRQPGFSPKAGKVVVNHEEQKAPKATATPKAATKSGGDDLTKVKGVGDNIAVMLKANGVATFADMAATSFDRYKELLKANGMSKFRDPSQWAARAAELVNAPAKPAAEPKKRGRQPGFSPKTAAAAPKAKAAATDPAAAPKKRGRQPGYSPKAAKGAVSAPVAEVKAAPAKAPAKPKGPPAKPDDLTQVKGVGQRVADALNKEGIYTYRDMAEVSLERYKEILKENNMSKFRDPSNWASIATDLAGKK